VQDLAAELDLVTEEAVAVLRDVTIPALRNERSKGIGPPFVRLGREVYYLKSGLIALVRASTIMPRETATLVDGKHRRRKARAA
jgi:hypothetical protein